MAGEGKRYSAGAIFLQVVPVFANVQRAIEDEAKNIDRALGDSMEKSGERAGERAGKAANEAIEKQVKKLNIGDDLERQFRDSVYGINKALDGVDTSKLGKKLRSDLKDLRAELDAIRNTDLTVDDNFDKVKQRLGAVSNQLADMQKRSKVVLDLDGIPQFNRKVAEAQATIKAIDGEIKIDVDTRGADRAMGRFEKQFKKTTARAAASLASSVNKEVKEIADELKALNSLSIGVDFSGTRARRELSQLAEDLQKLDSDDADIDVRIDVQAALRDLAAFEAAMRKIDGQDVEVDVKVNDKGTKDAGHDAERAANSFRSFNIVLLAVASAGPALVPVLAAIAGGLVALGPASAVAVAGLGSVLVGFSGIGDALTALGNQQDQAATTAQTAANRQVSAANQIRNAQQAVADAERNAARAAEDAAERVADARRNAARAAEDAAERVADARERAAEAIEEALDRQKEAQEEYRDAVKEVREAEQDLADARAQAKADAEGIAGKQRQNAVDERQAVLDLMDAQAVYNATMADGSATNVDKEQASINLEQAQIALNEIRDEQVALAAEAADYAANGVEGNESVKSAQEQLTEAVEAEAEALEATKEADREVREQRLESARMIKEALEDQKEVLADNGRAIKRALEDQAESHADNARAIERAKQALTDARKQAVDDLAQIDAQQQAVNAAFDKLGPAGRKFALFLFSLRSGFYEFRDAVQQAMLPAIQEAIEGFIGSANAGKAKTMIVELARGFGEFVKVLSQSFQGPAWASFFEMMATTGVQIQAAYGDAFVKFMEALASLLVTSAPFALRFAEGLANLMDRFAEWAASKSGQQQFLDFIEYVEDIGPAVLQFIGSLAGAVVNMAKALAPYGEMVLGALTAFLEFLSNMDQDILGALLTGLAVVLLSSQVAYAFMNVAMAGAALFATTIGPWIFAIVGIGIALGVLYKTNEDFAKFIDKAWGKIKDVFVEAWEDHIGPALENLWGAIENLWKRVFIPFLRWLEPALMWVIDNLLPLVLAGFSVQFNVIAWIVNNILIPAFELIGTILKWVWEKVVKPTLGFLAAGFKTAFKAIKWVWDNILWPIIDLIGSTLSAVWRNVVKPVLERMAKGWKSYSDDVSAVWNDYIKPIFEAVGDFISKHVEPKFEKAVGALTAIWDTLKYAFATPIKFVIDTVVNKGLIAGFNWVAEKVGSEKMGEIPIPEFLNQPKPDWASKAVGGVLPGYSPGRDNLTFYSPQVGQLNLSGGEGILRPEAVRALGGERWLNSVNHAAMSGGIGGVQKKIFGGFAKGGRIVFPVRGGYVNRTDYNLGHDGMDINHPNDASGRVPFVSATDGYVTTTGYSRGYGNAVFVASPYGELVYGHALDGSVRVSPGNTVKAGDWLANIGNTGNSSGPHLHFGFPGGTFYGAEALLSGAMQPGKIDVAGGDPKALSMPKWAKTILAAPIKWMKGLIEKPMEAFREKFDSNPLVDMIAKVPGKLIKKSVQFVKDLIPAPGKAWDKLAGNRDSDDTPVAPGPESSLPGQQPSGNGVSAFTGGILPYNGTMMYDSGGYLPPGLTTVVNLTGKPEPVFTADQFDGMEFGSGEAFHYEPHFHKADLTAADVVDDIDFTRRKIRREGRYGRSKL